MKRKILLLVGVICLIMALSLTGCGGGDSAESEEKPQEATVETAEEKEAEEVAEEEKEVVIAIVNDPVSLDPHVRDSGTEMQIAAHLYDSLVDYNPDLSLKPGLAESWEIKDDGMTWEFKLRKDVKFLNGNDFNADDVEFSLNRIINDDMLQMGVYLFRIKEVKKVDDYTVQIITKIKYPVFAGSLKHIMMLDKETCENMTSEEISSNPNGTGRYKLVNRVKESELEMEANENYWGEIPEIKKVKFRIISNSATRTAALLSGDVDFISSVPNPSLSCNYLGFNQHDDDPEGTISPNPLKKVEVRKAIYHAIDINAIIETSMRGLATPAISYMPSFVNGFDSSAERLAYDPELSKKLLTDAGYADGFELRIDALSDGQVNESQVAQAVASYLQKVGIKMEVNLIPRAMFYEKTSPKNMQSSFFMARWGDSSYDGKPGLGEGNKGKYTNPKVDEILEIATVEEDKAKRAEMVKEVDAITRADAAYIPLFFADALYGVKSELNYTPRADGHIHTWDISYK